MTTKAHWEHVYQSKTMDEVSWYKPHLDVSLRLIDEAAPDRGSAIIDVGGGEATLVDDLVARGYSDVTVLDISQAAIEKAVGGSHVSDKEMAGILVQGMVSGAMAALTAGLLSEFMPMLRAGEQLAETGTVAVIRSTSGALATRIFTPLRSG